MSEHERAYTLGRLLAALDRLGVVRDAERAYSLVTLDPARLGEMLTRATTQGEAARDYLMPIVAALPADGAWAGPLTDEELSSFALGYYRQRADIRKGIPPGMGDDEMTVPQAAAYLGLRRETVNQAIRDGRLPARRIGDKVLVIRRSDVDAYNQRRKPRPLRPEREA